MTTYVSRRLLQMIPLLLGVSVIVFVIIHSAPGDPYTALINPRWTAEQKAHMRQIIGLDKPLITQYFNWLRITIQGNLGYSIGFQRPVADLIRERIGPTIVLTMTAEVLALAIAVPMGVISAVRQYSKLDYASNFLAFVGISLPSFFMVLVAQVFFGVKLHLLPMNYMTTAAYIAPNLWYALLDRGKHLLLPATLLAIRGLAVYTRFTRSSMLEVIRQDFIRTARAKGVGERLVIYKHALRNGLIPLITLEGLSIPTLLSGAVVFEYLFTWPGMGNLTVEALESRDYPVLMTVNLLLALIVMIANLMADIGYAAADPRIRYQ